MVPKRLSLRNWLVCGLTLAVVFVATKPAWAADPTPGQSSPAKNDRLGFEVKVAPMKVRRGQIVKVAITGTPGPTYHTYPITQRAPKQDEVGLNKLTFEKTAGIQPLWPIVESKPAWGIGETVDGSAPVLEFDEPFEWSQEVLVLPDAKPGKVNLRFKIRGQVCDASHCVPFTKKFDKAIVVSEEAAVPLTPALETRLKAKQPQIKVVDPDQKQALAPTKPVAASRSTAQARDLLSFILAGFFWGAVSLVTPCVFPMIPITVSFFLKQSEKQHHRPITMAVVYCATIVTVLTVAAIAFLSFFQVLSTNWIMNFALGGLFIFFALSLFGMYEIELPSGLTRFTSGREGQGGLIGTMFMALTFTIISFACVAPFLGGFGGTAAGAQMSWLERILGGLAFSLTFAAPFFFLALFPSLLKSLPKSGNWLNSVKVVMGFLEMAAAFKFLRAAEVVHWAQPVFFTYELVLGVYVTLSILCGLYLLGAYRLPHDTPSEHLTVPRLILSTGFISLGLYLMPGLFRWGVQGENQRPAGIVFAWLDAFLLPNEAKGDLPWKGDFHLALDVARGDGKLVFIDFTGVTCTNCNLNERDIFPQPSVKKLLRQYELVKLYTDRVPNDFYTPEQLASFAGGTTQQQKDASANLDFEKRVFNVEQLPLYAIVRPKGAGTFDIVAQYDEGRISSAARFAQFLAEPLTMAGLVAQLKTP